MSRASREFEEMITIITKRIASINKESYNEGYRVGYDYGYKKALGTEVVENKNTENENIDECKNHKDHQKDHHYFGCWISVNREFNPFTVTNRLRVPGGWIYRTESKNSMAMIFVKD